MSGFGNQKKESFLVSKKTNKKTNQEFDQENREWAEKLFSAKIVHKKAALKTVRIYFTFKKLSHIIIF